MRLSRPCYDKPHRCPGWAGGGDHYARNSKYDCDNGSIRTRKPDPDFPGEYVHPGVAWWRFGHCTKCDVVTWPWVTRRLDPHWVKGQVVWRARWVVWPRVKYAYRWAGYHVVYRALHPRRYRSEQILDAVLDG